jgi:charged multivesicular body protein 7
VSYTFITDAAQVMAAYEQSTATLKTLLANPLLDRDRVDNTTEALAETLADQREIDEAIQQGGQVAMAAGGRVAADEDELEKELADMVQAEKDRAKEEAEAKDKAKVEQEKEEEKERVDKEHSKLADLTVAPRTDIARLLPNATSGSITSDMTAEQLEEQYAAARSRQIADKERMERLGRDQARQSEMAAE